MKMKIQLKNIKSEQTVYMLLMNRSLSTVKMPNIPKLAYTFKSQWECQGLFFYFVLVGGELDKG